MPYKNKERSKEYQREYQKQWRAKNQEKIIEIRKRNAEKAKAYGRFHRSLPEVKEKNRLLAKAYKERCRERRKTDPEFRAHEIEWGKKYRKTAKCQYNLRRKHLRQYGITPEEYDEMFTKQNGVCAICKQSETWKSPNSTIISALTVDHDHTTGKVRGLLCRSCNGGLGRLGDNLDGILKVVQYLQQSQ